MSPYAYINAIFSSKQAKNGGVVSRQIANVQKYASTQFLIEEVKRQGFHIVEIANQYIIICNSGDIKLLH